MKKLAKFLSLALLTIGCCFSAHARIDGKPMNNVKFQTFISNTKKIFYDYFSRCKFYDQTNEFDKKYGCNHLSYLAVGNLYWYTIANRGILDNTNWTLVNCRAWSRYIAKEFKDLDIQYARVSLITKNKQNHSVILYSAINGTNGKKEWFVCDCANAFVHCVKDNITNRYPLFRCNLDLLQVPPTKIS